MTNTEKIKKIAEILGGSINLSRCHDSSNIGAFNIELPNVHKWAGIVIRFGQYNLDGKFGISTCNTKNFGEYSISYDGLPKEIKVSLSKTPEQIAKDIQRRLLPIYQEWLEQLEPKIEKIDENRLSKERRVHEFAQIITDAGEKARITMRNFEVSYYKGMSNHCDVKLFSADVNMDIRCDSDKAKRILEILLEDSK